MPYLATYLLALKIVIFVDTEILLCLWLLSGSSPLLVGQAISQYAYGE
jgi:hypothetical protein